MRLPGMKNSSQRSLKFTGYSIKYSIVFEEISNTEDVSFTKFILVLLPAIPLSFIRAQYELICWTGLIFSADGKTSWSQSPLRVLEFDLPVFLTPMQLNRRSSANISNVEFCDPHRFPQKTTSQSHSNLCFPYGDGSIPINTIFSGMNIHLPAIIPINTIFSAILMFTRGTRFWHTAISFLPGTSTIQSQARCIPSRRTSPRGHASAPHSDDDGRTPRRRSWWSPRGPKSLRRFDRLWHVVVEDGEGKSIGKPVKTYGPMGFLSNINSLW